MKLINATVATLVVAALTMAAHADGEHCFGFDRLPSGSAWSVGSRVDMGDLGEVLVRELLRGGEPVAENETNVFLALSDAKTAGGTAPEVYGKNIAVQMIPKGPVSRIAMKVSHQPGAAGGRAAFVEVNDERYEFNGSLLQLNGRSMGGDAKARITAELPASSGNFVSGRMKVESKAGIRSFTIGAAELHLDDVCFTR